MAMRFSTITNADDDANSSDSARNKNKNIEYSNNNWLVVSTPLKNNSQLGSLFPIYGKMKNVPNHQPG